MKTTETNVYRSNGFASRREYLEYLVEEFGPVIYELADILGPSEDFDGLVTMAEDYADRD